jgi:hypothetical protein
LDDVCGETPALIASAVPPLLWSMVELARTRRVDAISLAVVASILLTIIATAMGGSPKLIQIRDAMVTGAFGVMFLASLALPRPLIFFLARAAMARNTEAGLEAYEAIWHRPGVPAVFRWLTVLWGVGLVAQTGALCWLAWIWPIPRYLLVAPVISAAIFAGLMLASLAYIARNPAAWPILRGRAGWLGAARIK